MFNKKFHIFNSKIATHVAFWVIYYVAFSLIWSSGQKLLNSFFLEFILLPMRIMAVYITLYYLLPNFLLKKRYSKFIFSYLGLIIIASVCQRFFIHFFYENLLNANPEEGLFSLKMIFRASILINTTVFFVLSIKIFQLYTIEKEKNEASQASYIKIKADRRIHKVNINDILFIEGKGNYTTYNLGDASKITAYGSIKTALENLPPEFIRVHKSYVVNKTKIKSFDNNTIEIKGQFIPRGKSASDDTLTI
ncbi:LytTR family DNA-binding domain-containing protein [uncultured Psychroserpens sp.]|uniref:LytR/AlgR family response regulator transcription factor n=1 Tax=uncultured Psychroserpens sp. TaxID=255436 RepID=UPI00261AF2D4|nr:LytTR family DNA-binding domain-containing protein [uncultured Psychroserpens sp.]